MVEAPGIEVKDDGVIIEAGRVMTSPDLDELDALDHYAKTPRVGRTIASQRRNWNPRDMSHWAL